MKALIEKIKSLNVIKPGKFILRSGRKSNVYVDLKKAYGDPEFLSMACNGLYEILPEDTTYVVGMGLGGIPLASAFSVLYNIPACLVRDKPKRRGTNQQIECYIPTEKDRGVIFDDVFTSGTCIQETAEALKETRTTIIQACVILKRGNNKLEFPVRSILTLKDLTK